MTRLRTLATAIAVGLVVAACGGGGGPSMPEPVADAGGEAGFFLACRQQLPDAPPDLAGALRVGIASFAQPSAGAVGPGEPNLTLGVSISYVGQGPEIAVLDVVPWKVGDVDQGPGAFLHKSNRYGFTIKPGERVQIDIPVVVERVNPIVTDVVPPGDDAPVPDETPSETTLGLGGTGVLAAAAVAQQPTPSPPPQPPPAPQPTPTPDVTRPLPGPTPQGPPPPPAPGSPFDPDAGVQVILVSGFIGNAVAPDAHQNVTPVACDEVPARYPGIFQVNQGIPVPLDRVL